MVPSNSSHLATPTSTTSMRQQQQLPTLVTGVNSSRYSTTTPKRTTRSSPLQSASPSLTSPPAPQPSQPQSSATSSSIPLLSSPGNTNASNNSSRKKQRNPTNYVWTPAENKELMTWTSEHLPQVWVKASVVHAHKIKKAIYANNPHITAENIRHKVNNLKAKFRKIKGRWADSAESDRREYMTSEIKINIENEFADYFMIEEMINKCGSNMSPPNSPQLRAGSLTPQQTNNSNNQLSPSFAAGQQSQNPGKIRFQSTTSSSDSGPSPLPPHHPPSSSSTQFSQTAAASVLGPQMSHQLSETGQQALKHHKSGSGSGIITQRPSSDTQSTGTIMSRVSGTPAGDDETYLRASSSAYGLEYEQLRIDKERLQLRTERLELDVARLQSELRWREMEDQKRQSEQESLRIANKKAIAELSLVEYQVKLAMAQLKAFKKGQGRENKGIRGGSGIQRTGGGGGDSAEGEAHHGDQDQQQEQQDRHEQQEQRDQQNPLEPQQDQQEHQSQFPSQLGTYEDDEEDDNGDDDDQEEDGGQEDDQIGNLRDGFSRQRSRPSTTAAASSKGQAEPGICTT